MADPIIPQTLVNLYAAFAPDSMDEAIRNPRRELIGTMFYLYQQAVDAAEAAAASAAAMETTLNNAATGRAVAVTARAVGDANFTASRLSNIAAVTTNTSSRTIKFEFTTPFAADTYAVLYSFSASSGVPQYVPTVITKNTNYVQFTFSNTDYGNVRSANLFVL